MTFVACDALQIQRIKKCELEYISSEQQLNEILFNIDQMSNNQGRAKYSISYAIHSFIATYVSGVLHPLDLIKTRFQSHDGLSQADNLVPKYQGILNGLKTIYQVEGLQGVYKGFHISVFSQATATSLFFWLYQLQKANYDKKGYSSMNSVLISSTEASLFGTTVTQPLWVIKTRMLLNTTSRITERQNFVFSYKQIQRQEGFRGYFKGFGLSLILSINGIAQMYSYQALKKLYTTLNIAETGMLEKNFICGGASKLFVVLLSYPITTVRTRIQQNQFIKDDRTKKYSGVSQIIKKTLRQQGINGFYKGLQANLLKGILQKGVYFYTYELLKLTFISSNAEAPIN